MQSQMPRIGVVFRPEVPPERLREFAAAAEAANLDDLWLWEDCFREGGLTTASAALSWTTSLRIGLGLMPVPLRNPALAAMEIAALARLFPGRFVPAVGHGVPAWMDQVGARPRSPLTLLREWGTAARSLLLGETVTVSGDYVRLDRVALDWPPSPAPPLLIGARGPRTLALAGEIADGLVLDAGISPAGVRRAVATAAAQRAQEIVVYLLCGEPGSEKRIQAELGPSTEPLADRIAVGSVSDIAHAIDAFARAGATAVILQSTADDPDIRATIQLASAAKIQYQTSLTSSEI